ncbi:MAG: HAD family phosphatase [Clostridiales bacterium]|nr:HAD family phosphatase [Clostridiales bacterium]
MFHFKAAIFDMDGTLIDSMNMWKKIAEDFLKKRHLTMPKDYLSIIAPMSFLESAKYTVDFFHLDEDARSVMEEWNQMAIVEYTHHIGLKPYVKEYLTYLKDQNVKLCVATASPRMYYEPVLKRNDIYGMFDAFTTTDEVSRGKEFPDIYLLAAKKMNTCPEDCIVFEDILAGVKAAKSAGMKIFGVYDSCSAHEKTEMEAIADGYILDFSEMY